jgi:porin
MGVGFPAACAAMILWGNPAGAEPDVSQSNQTQAASDGGAFGFLDGISRSSTMLGDMWGLRPWLSQYGVTLTLQETSEIFGNVRAGPGAVSTMTD